MFILLIRIIVFTSSCVILSYSMQQKVIISVKTNKIIQEIPVENSWSVDVPLIRLFNNFSLPTSSCTPSSMSSHIDKLNEDDDRFGHSDPIFQLVFNEAHEIAEEDIGRGVESPSTGFDSAAATSWLCRMVVVSIDWSTTVVFIVQPSTAPDDGVSRSKFRHVSEQVMGRRRE